MPPPTSEGPQSGTDCQPQPRGDFLSPRRHPRAANGTARDYLGELAPVDHVVPLERFSPNEDVLPPASRERFVLYRADLPPLHCAAPYPWSSPAPPGRHRDGPANAAMYH